MTSVIGWGLLIGGAWIAREIARLQKEVAEKAVQPVPVRSKPPHRQARNR